MSEYNEDQGFDETEVVHEETILGKLESMLEGELMAYLAKDPKRHVNDFWRDTYGIES